MNSIAETNFANPEIQKEEEQVLVNPLDVKSPDELVQELEDSVSDGTVLPSKKIDEPLVSLNDIISDDTFAQICQSLNEMNIIEATKSLRELQVQKKLLEDSYQFANSIKAMMATNSGINMNIAQANLQEMIGMEKDVNEFLASYDELDLRLSKLIEHAENVLKKFDDVEKTTSYMNDAMISIIDNKLSLIAQKGFANNHPVSIYYRTLKDVFTNRRTVDYIVNKIPQLIPNINRLKRSFRDKKKGASNRIAACEFINNTFRLSFSREQLIAVTEYITKLFDNSDATFYTMYALATIYSTTSQYKKTGEHKWVEVLFMNILDIITDSYDLEGGNEVVDAGLLRIKEAMGY